MKRKFYAIWTMLLAFVALQANAQVTDGLYRALTDANSARVVALGGVPLPVHDGDLQTAVFNPSAISPEMNNQMTLSYVGDFKMGTNFATAQYSHTFENLGSFAASVQYYNYGKMQYASESGPLIDEQHTGPFCCGSCRGGHSGGPAADNQYVCVQSSDRFHF